MMETKGGGKDAKTMDDAACRHLRVSGQPLCRLRRPRRERSEKRNQSSNMGGGMNTSGTGRSHPLCLPQDEEYIKIRKV
ncbi:hypothetical protein B4114_1474 [Geobacillus stearothermophilus]|uniref:Uncharacterized protein n=1 Tax=Geobacillus stearothermophilus TaxID=1422 RepID=A0A150N5S8_GEOSE|nr:hypothetical protein B4114_1474 [Geobacillus stearothermophilus]